MNPSSLLAPAIAYLIGFLYSVILGGYAIAKTLTTFYIGYEKGRTTEKWRGQVVGYLERALYTASSLAGHPQFIAVWLALKVAGQWERWKADWSDPARKKQLARQDTARSMYAGYLLGNGLSIAYAASAALAITTIINAEYLEAALLLVALPCANAILYAFIKRKTSSRKKTKPASRTRKAEASKKRGAA